MEGLSIDEARKRNNLFDINGLIVASRADVTDFQRPFALDHAPVKSFVDAIKALKPTGIIGVSTVPKLFTRGVIEAMSEINERSIIFPYSNPTSRSECTAKEAYRWSDGRAIFASGSPFPPVEIIGRKFIRGQGNNVYIFPATGMAVYATVATRVTEEMFIVAAKAVAEQVTEDNLASGLIYPPQSHILDASLHVAQRVATSSTTRALPARRARPTSGHSLTRAPIVRPTSRSERTRCRTSAEKTTASARSTSPPASSGAHGPSAHSHISASVSGAILAGSVTLGANCNLEAVACAREAIRCRVRILPV